MEYDKKTMAMAHGKHLPISTKKSVAICQYLRGKSLKRAKQILEDAMNMKRPIPFTRYNQSVSHRPGMGPAKYAVKTAQHLLMLLESAEANAQHKGLDVNTLKISHLKADGAGTVWRYGRHKRIRAKRSHVEVVLSQIESKKPAD